MTDEDKELELLKAKRLLEMQKNISHRQRFEEIKSEAKVSQASPRELVLKILGHRGLEVLENAESQFPNETRIVVEKLAELVRNGEITDTIDGVKLLTLFRSLGIRVRVKTTIKVEQDGKMVSLSDRLKSDPNPESEPSEQDI
jgi:DNA-binding TFAR19-related protein (PDSD5 family)